MKQKLCNKFKFPENFDLKQQLFIYAIYFFNLLTFNEFKDRCISTTMLNHASIWGLSM
jgi:hypothetical protein